MRKFSPLPLIAFLLLTHLFLFFCFRLILFYFVSPQITDHDAILEGLYIGLKFDMRYVVFLTLLSNLCLIIPFSERLLAENRFFRYCVCFWQTVVFFVYLLIYLIDILVYFYLNQRVDLTLLDLLVLSRHLDKPRFFYSFNRLFWVLEQGFCSACRRARA